MNSMCSLDASLLKDNIEAVNLKRLPIMMIITDYSGHLCNRALGQVVALREVPGAKTANFASWHLNVPDSELRIFPKRGPQFYAELLIKKCVSACGAARELSISHPSQPTGKAKDIGKPLIIIAVMIGRKFC